MLEAEYGFAILIGAGWDTVTTEPWEGLARGWSISLSVTELLVSTIHTANPEIPAHLNEHESFFEFFVGEPNPDFRPGYSSDWRAAVQQPLALVTEGAVFRVETETWDKEGRVDMHPILWNAI